MLPTNTDTSLSGEAIAGIVIGAVAAAAFIGIGIYFIKKKRYEGRNQQMNNDVSIDRIRSRVCMRCMNNPVVKMKPCGH
jgi:hypothetical protein